MNYCPQGEVIRLMTNDDLHLVLSWRNHPEIRRYMFKNHEIKFSEHRRWFDQIEQNPNRKLLIYMSNGIPTGFIQFNQMSETPVADWGFYLAPEAPKGTGRLLGHAALNYAFKHLGLHKVSGQALANNKSSIRMHIALGFKQEGLLREQHYDEQTYHDVVCFGLMVFEWQSEQK